MAYPHYTQWVCENDRVLRDAKLKDMSGPLPKLTHYELALERQNIRKEAYAELRKTIVSLERRITDLEGQRTVLRNSLDDATKSMKQMEKTRSLVISAVKAEHAKEITMMNRTLELRLQYIAALEAKLNA